MTTIYQLTSTHKPFSIIQYFENMIGTKSTYKKYEAIYFDENKKPKHHFLNEKELIFFKDNLHLYPRVIKNKDGAVYEFMNFKEYKKQIDPYGLIKF